MSCFNQNRLSAILRTIEERQQHREEDFRYDTYDEGKYKNVATFLQWILGHAQEADRMAEHEVNERPSNILALSNSAYIAWQKGMIDEAWEQLEKLEALRAGDPQQYDDLDMEGRPL